MRLLKHPGFWVVFVVVVFTLTIGGRQSITVTNGPDLSPTIDVGEADDLIEIQQESVADSTAPVPPTAESDSPAERVEKALVEDEPELDAVGGPTDEEAAMVMAALSESDSQTPTVLTHVVQKGESLSQIAAMYGIDTTTMLAANDIFDPDRLLVGQSLNILTVPGALHSVRSGESLWVISRVYDTDIDTIAKVNEIVDPGRIQPQQQLIIPGREAANIAKSLRSNQLVSADGQLLRAFSWPVTGRISSLYGPRWGTIHHGLDIAVVTGTPVRAAASGRVIFSGWNGGYGNLVSIDHGDGVETRYAHNSRLAVNVGDVVSRGQIIAYSGNTGNSTGPHVHFEIRLHGRSYDPLSYLR